LKNLIRMSLVAACTALLAACGGGAKLQNKQEAANAAFAASQGANGANGSLFRLAQQNAGSNIEVTVSCPKAGKATIHYDIDGTGGTGATSLKFTLSYDSCSYNGKNTMNGSMAVTMNANVSSSSVTVDLTMKGKVTFTGEVDDFVDVNVVETVDASKLAAGEGATVSVKLNGTIATSSQSHTFNQEAVTVSAGGDVHKS
jgi:hypothetical protein